MAFAQVWPFIKDKYVLLDGILNRITIAVIIFIVGLIIGKLAGNFITRILKELEINTIIKKASGKTIRLEENLGSFISYIIYFFAGVMALNQLGLTTTVLTMFSGAILIIIVIALILGIKDLIPNLIAGFMIYKNGQFKVGDTIEVAGVKGKVKNIRLIETTIEKGKSDTVFLPNSLIFKNQLKVIKEI